MVRLTVDELGDSKQFICQSSSIYFACILKGEADGIIWGDQREKPEFLVVWSPYQEGFQLMGRPLCKEEWQNFRKWFNGEMIRFLKEQKLEYFEYGADTKALAETMQKLLSDKEICVEPQQLFRWSGQKPDLQLPSGYIIQKVDRDFLEKDHKNKAFIVEELKGAYGEIEGFFEHGIAYVALKDEAIVARADMLFSDQGYGNISVHTEEAHRRKGLSTYLAMKTIEDTIAQGLIPIWDCTKDNLASKKTAEKCGFVKCGEAPIYWLDI